MTETDAAETPQPAQLNVLSQYVRQLTFNNTAAQNGENPSGKPTINVQVNVDNRSIGENRYIVSLGSRVAAEGDGAAMFSIELDYVGVFRLTNVPEQSLAPVLSIECPRLLFPFARRIIAEVTRDGGFPPLMLDPIDFATLYRQQLAQRAAANGETSDIGAL